MRAINHALTGAVIGLAVGEPAIAAPAALASHFVLDAIPHHGIKNPTPKYLRSRIFRNLLYVDALLCVGLVVVLFASQPLNWQLAAFCAFLAASPDFLSFGFYKNALQGAKKLSPKTTYSKFAKRIQWFERPIGTAVEIAWFVAAAVLLAPFLR